MPCRRNHPSLRGLLLLTWLLGTWLLTTAGSADDRPAASGSSGQASSQIAAHIANLGSNEYSVRRVATRGLFRHGESSIGALAEAVHSTDREVQGRSIAILQQFATSSHSGLRYSAYEALEQLAGSSDERVARCGDNALLAIGRYAAEHLKRLGAQLQIENHHVVGVMFSNAKLSDHDLLPLQLLPKLRKLELRFSPITDAGLEHVGHLHELETLNLQGTRVTDLGMRHIAHLTNIHTFSVERTAVTDAGLCHLRNLTKLHTLYLGGSRVQGHGLPQLKHLPITYLSFQSSQLSDTSADSIASLLKLKTLGLDDTPVTDACLPRLRSLADLEVLWLDNTGVTDACVEELARFRGLKVLHCKKTAISEEGQQRLRRLLPNARILAGPKPPDR